MFVRAGKGSLQALPRQSLPYRRRLNIKDHCRYYYCTVSFSNKQIEDPDPFLGLLDPDPDPLRKRYGSGSFYHQAKIVRKTLIPTALQLLFDFLSLKNEVNVPSKTYKQKNFFCLFFCILKVNGENNSNAGNKYPGREG
jgi:hypothetical protein